MLSFPNAKINIGLYITNKRNDGYHDIESVFYPIINYYDCLEIIETQGNGNIDFTSVGIEIPGTNDGNLCVKAYYAINAISPLPAVKMLLKKNIAIGAGLGGGSADAAFAIHLINKKFELKLSLAKQLKIAATLGSDCSFFIHNTPCFASGRGEVLQKFSFNLKGKKIVLVNPAIHINTQDAYSGIIPKQPKYALAESILKPIAEWQYLIKNDFEDSVFLKEPAIEKIKNELYKKGALYASMSGSGSTVYGIFDNVPDFYFPENYFVGSFDL